jgi:hypothetical protein
MRPIGTPALFSHYDALYVVVRTGDHSLWSWQGDRRGLWTQWQLAGAVSDDPDIGVDPTSGLVNVVARGTDDRLYRWQSKDPDRSGDHVDAGWGDPELIDADHAVTGTPAITIYHRAMHIVARGPSNAVHHWWKDQIWHWEAMPGAYTGNPDLFQFDDQLQSVGPGADRNLFSIWYDSSTGIWNPESQYVPVGE